MSDIDSDYEDIDYEDYEFTEDNDFRCSFIIEIDENYLSYDLDNDIGPYIITEFHENYFGFYYDPLHKFSNSIKSFKYSCDNGLTWTKCKKYNSYFIYEEITRTLTRISNENFSLIKNDIITNESN